jgi:hypothetical protein
VGLAARDLGVFAPSMESATHSLSVAAHAFRLATYDVFLFEHVARELGHDGVFVARVV